MSIFSLVLAVLRSVGVQDYCFSSINAYQWGRFVVFRRHKNAPSNLAGHVLFRCNICGMLGFVPGEMMNREIRTCRHCGSTVRFRAIVHLLAEELLNDDVMLPDFPNRSFHGFGLSDWEGYADTLADRWQYTNTFYHREPFLDLTDIDAGLEETLDFLISSDVFEHIVPPVSVAFDNAYRLLKPGGLFLLTVPYVLDGDTQEHFPDLFDYDIVQEDGEYVLYNKTRDGRMQRYTDLTFHGGPGLNLELRMFSERSVRRALEAAGFVDIRVRRAPCFEHGIVWLEGRHLPFTARRPE